MVVDVVAMLPPVDSVSVTGELVGADVTVELTGAEVEVVEPPAVEVAGDVLLDDEQPDATSAATMIDEAKRRLFMKLPFRPGVRGT
jgi:hypothetical protein